MPLSRRLAVLVISFCAVTLASAQPLVVQYPRVYAINHNPWLESRAKLLNQQAGWNNPASNNNLYVSDLKTSSHGLVKFRISTSIDADEWPIKNDGFRYTDASYLQCLSTWSGWHSPDGVDYKAVFRDYDLARRVDFGEVDEVFMAGAPYFGYWETTMAGLGGYWCNSGPQQRIACSRIYVTMGFNYERYIGEMLEDYGHRSESILWETYGSWEAQPTHAWNRFTLIEKNNPGQAACGNVHYAPNSLSDYDWGNTTPCLSTCNDWLNNYPNLTGAKTTVSCPEWGCDIRVHHNWWFAHFPHVAGSLNDSGGLVRLNNWWEYTQNFNAHTESNGDHLPGGNPPAAQPFSGSTFRLTTNTVDDFRPQMNAAGRVVWSGYDAASGRWKIMSANMDGTDVRTLRSSRGAEHPRINASGKVVWQDFDGRAWQIYTANSDATGVLKITNTTMQCMHPDINDAGRICWQQFDGEDYEIFAANADGTSIVQITNNTHGGTGKPREDVWPRINAAGRLAWMGYDGANWEVFSADAIGGTITNVSNDSRENEYPEISATGRIVWQSWSADNVCSIYMAESNGTGKLALTSNALAWWPRINATNDIVWMQRVGSDWQIKRRTAAGVISQLTSGTTHQQHPVIDDGGRVAWQGFDGSYWQIYLLNGATTTKVTTSTYDNRAPYLADGRLAWHGQAALGTPSDPNYPGPTYEIFTATTQDVFGPTLVSVSSIGNPQRVVVEFSEAVDPNTAEAPANYGIDQGIIVLAAVLGSDGRTVVLTTSPLTTGITYTLTVNNVEDTLGNAVAPNTSRTFVPEAAQRVGDVLALWDFNEGTGNIVHDVSGVGTPLDLTIAAPANVTWTSGGLRFDAATAAATPAAATKITDACKLSNELTVEAWVVPATAAMTGPARLFTVSAHENSRSVTLAQGNDNGTSGAVYVGRVESTQPALPAVVTPAATAQATLQHVVYTRDAAGTAWLFVDGEPLGTAQQIGDFSSWNALYRLAIANEPTLSRPWLGEFKLVAFYDRALSWAEVLQNFDFGTGDSNVQLGDLNCDGLADFKDINPFVLLLSDPAAWEAAYPGCPLANGDCNLDGSVDFKDINPFVAVLSGG